MDLKTVDHLLTTTRSVRKRLDFSRPVPRDVIERAIEIAVQAPTGGNNQGWHFVVVTDADKRRALADLYRKGWEIYTSMPREQLPASDPRAGQLPRVISSAQYLTDHFHEAPAMIVPCIEGRFETQPQFAQASLYGSILPAVWSLMLALRARGVGSAWTTIHLIFEKEAAEVLGIPPHVTQAALLPVAYYTGGDFKPAKRLSARELTSWNAWGRRS
ncbi:MAG TPA: nitroreductase family protein [Candidatus Binatia bacterium]|nr:nitroreductase family protein [Candidatus Binatia bacterium]